MDRYLDFWNLMAYDYAGSWDHVAAHQANVYPSTSNPTSSPFSTYAAIKYYKGQGIPPSKINLGIPLYGRSFLSTGGPGKAFSGIGPGSFEQGVWDFKALPRDGAEEKQSNEAIASWSYDSEQRIMISYDTLEVVKQKVNFVEQEGLGGAMWWESSGDKGGDQSLIKAVSTISIDI